MGMESVIIHISKKTNGNRRFLKTYDSDEIYMDGCLDESVDLSMYDSILIDFNESTSTANDFERVIARLSLDVNLKRKISFLVTMKTIPYGSSSEYDNLTQSIMNCTIMIEGHSLKANMFIAKPSKRADAQLGECISRDMHMKVFDFSQEAPIQPGSILFFLSCKKNLKFFDHETLRIFLGGPIILSIPVILLTRDATLISMSLFLSIVTIVLLKMSSELLMKKVRNPLFHHKEYASGKPMPALNRRTRGWGLLLCASLCIIINLSLGILFMHGSW